MARHTFQVDHIQQGLERIKEQLGPSAIIVKTRRVTADDGSQMLEITAESEDGVSSEHIAHDAPTAPPSTAHQTAHQMGQLQKTILGLTEQIQRVQSEMRHLRVEVHDARAQGRDEAEQGALSKAPSISFSPAFFEHVHADELRSLRLALTQLRDQSGDRQLFETLVEIHAALTAQDVLPVHADMVCARLLSKNQPGDKLFESARALIEDAMPSAPAPWTIRPPQGALEVQLIIGPAGSGKTSALAKIAAHASIKEGRQVALISADAFRIGGHDQLQTYAELIDIPFASAEGVAMLEKAILVLAAQRPELDLLLVDATSYWPFEAGSKEGMLDTDTLMELHTSQIAHFSFFVALPATWSTRGLLAYVDHTRAVKPAGIIWTMLDTTHRFGALYSVSRDISIPTVLYSTGRAVPGDLSPPSALDPARTILMNADVMLARE